MSERRYDTARFQAAFDRCHRDPKSLTEEDLAELAVVNQKFADRARAKRAGLTGWETSDPDVRKALNTPLDLGMLEMWWCDGSGVLMETHRIKITEAHNRIEALEARIQHLESLTTALAKNGSALRDRLKG